MTKLEKLFKEVKLAGEKRREADERYIIARNAFDKAEKEIIQAEEEFKAVCKAFEEERDGGKYNVNE